MQPNIPDNLATPAEARPVVALKHISKRYPMWESSSARCVSALLAAARCCRPGGRTIRQEPGEKRRRYFPALQDVSFEIGKGESVGLIGRNGSGKSSLLQILAGVLRPTEGTGFVSGSVAALLELGTGFHPDFTGRENVLMNGMILGLPREGRFERLDRVARFAEIGPFMDQPVRAYSSGMLLRLAFASAISVDPDVLFVDEALAVGDVFFQQKCYRHMRERMAGRTRVLVTHDLHAVTGLCSRVLVLDKGRLTFDGEPLAAVEHYMKALHDEQAAGPRLSAPAAADTARPAPPEPTEWIDIPADAIGGKGDILIEKAAVRVQGNLGDAVVQPDDTVSIRMRIRTRTAKREVLFGYLIRDRVGMAVFGENSAGVSNGIVNVREGVSEVRFTFRWPEIQPGAYFLTLGVGEGADPIRHTIQCWAHRVAMLNAVCPGRTVHFLFNNPLRSFEVATPADAAETRP